MVSKQVMGLIGLGLLATFAAAQPADACMTEQQVEDKLSSDSSWVFSNREDIDVFKITYALKADVTALGDIDHVRAFQRNDIGKVEGVFINKAGCAVASMKMPFDEFSTHWNTYLTQDKDAFLDQTFVPSIRPV